MKNLPKIMAVRTFWHPASTPGSRRLESFCRYLAEDGWDVTLVALRPPPGLPVAEDDKPPPYRGVFLPHALRPGTLIAGLEQRLRKWFPGFLGDGYAQARRLVYREAAERLEHEHYDALLTTFPFEASLQVAHRLHVRSGLPWIADLRDLPDEFDVERRCWTTRRRAARVERLCRDAARLVTVSEPLQRALETRYGMRMPVDVVPNGYDENAFDACPETAASGFFDVLFCGGARRGDGRSAELLGRGVEVLRARGVDLEGVRIVLLGPNDAESLGLGRPGQLPVPVIRRGEVPHPEALAAMCSSAVLVSLASPGAEGILTSKIFEYARAGRPVLGIPRDHNGLDGFIERSRIGRACDTAEEVADYLSGLIGTWRKTGVLPATDVDRDFLAGFSRRAQARRLGEIIRQCL